MLRWPHAHHRGLRARQPAALPAIADNRRHQKRHLMITAIRYRRRRADLLSCWSSTGCGDTHSNAPSQPQGEPAMAMLDGYLNHQHQLLPPIRRIITPARAHAIRRTHLPHHPNPHSRVRGTFRPHHPRVRSLAAFGRRPPRIWHGLHGRHPKPLYGAIGVKERVAVLLSHFVTSPDCICGMEAPLPGCAERSSPKAACGAPEARGLTANAQPEPS